MADNHIADAAGEVEVEHTAAFPGAHREADSTWLKILSHCECQNRKRRTMAKVGAKAEVAARISILASAARCSWHFMFEEKLFFYGEKRPMQEHFSLELGCSPESSYTFRELYKSHYLLGKQVWSRLVCRKFEVLRLDYCTQIH